MSTTGSLARIAASFLHATQRHRRLLMCAALAALPFAATAQNLIVNPGFEDNPPPNFGNNIGHSILPWTLGPGQNSNVVKVDGPGGFNYGSFGPESDADPATGAGVVQHYLDIAAGSNDFYQAFSVPLCGSAPGQSRSATFSGWFSSRDNSAGNGSITIRSGTGSSGTVLATMSISVPAGNSQFAPWVQAAGAVTVEAGSTISYVVSMDNNLNFDEAFLSFDSGSCASAPMTLRKTWAFATVNDRAVLTASRGGVVVDTNTSIANSANETDADATPLTVFQGEAIVLAETLPGTNAATYTPALACTGGGTLSGDTLTVDDTGTPIECTFTNTGPNADLQISKTNTPADGPGDQADDTVAPGSTTTYDIVVRNAGPSSVTNAVLTDPAPTGVTGCALGVPACAVSSGSATCPTTGSGAGQLSIANLQSPAGVLIPSMADGSVLTFKVTCTVP